VFFLFFSKYYWIDKENFALSNLSKEIFFVFNLYKGLSLEFRPSANSLEECKGYIKAFEFDKNKNERVKLLDPYFEKNYDGMI
jgi:hypothetical protein